MGKVTVVVDTTKQRKGRMRKHLVVSTNDPDMPNFKLWMEGDVEPLIDYSPSTLTLAGLAGKPLEGELEIFRGETQAVEVVEAKDLTRRLETVEVEEIEKGARYKLTLKAPPSENPGRSRATVKLTLRLEDGSTRDHSVAINLDHRDRITITPRSSLIFPRAQTRVLLDQPPRQVKRDIYAFSGDPGVTFQVLDVKILNVPENLFDVKVTPVQEGTRYRISVSLLEYRPERNVSGLLRIVTDDPERPNREVRLVAQFGEPQFGGRTPPGRTGPGAKPNQRLLEGGKTKPPK